LPTSIKHVTTHAHITHVTHLLMPTTIM